MGGGKAVELKGEFQCGVSIMYKMISWQDWPRLEQCLKGMGEKELDSAAY